MGYRGSLPGSHPHYLTLERDSHLFLNIIDPDKPLFLPELFERSAEFIAKHISHSNVLVHCNQGLSRSPSIALVYLASIDVIPNESYTKAGSAFRELFPAYSPGLGISRYLTDTWANLISLCRQSVA